MITVLVADDDPLLREILAHKLGASGYAVHLAADGQAALELARNLNPSVIVLDGMMPILDGFEALRRLKADTALQSIPVVMLTALKREEDVVGALKLGAADYLPKPFNPDEMHDTLDRLTRQMS